MRFAVVYIDWSKAQKLDLFLPFWWHSPPYQRILQLSQVKASFLQNAILPELHIHCDANMLLVSSTVLKTLMRSN